MADEVHSFRNRFCRMNSKDDRLISRLNRKKNFELICLLSNLANRCSPVDYSLADEREALAQRLPVDTDHQKEAYKYLKNRSGQEQRETNSRQSYINSGN